MQLNDRDKSYLLDMKKYCAEVMDFVKDETYESFVNSKLKRYAIERVLEIVGKAANHVSREAQDSLAAIPWSTIVGLRNKIAHDYGEILSDRIWVIATRNIPDLSIILSKIEI